MNRYLPKTFTLVVLIHWILSPRVLIHILHIRANENFKWLGQGVLNRFLLHFSLGRCQENSLRLCLEEKETTLAIKVWTKRSQEVLNDNDKKLVCFILIRLHFFYHAIFFPSSPISLLYHNLAVQPC